MQRNALLRLSQSSCISPETSCAPPNPCVLGGFSGRQEIPLRKCTEALYEDVKGMLSLAGAAGDVFQAL